MARTDSRRELGASLTRYDLLLGLIPLVFLAALLVSSVAAVPLRVGLTGASVVSGVALVDALFLNPPRPPARGGE